jgi:hypothetical protein
MSSGVGRVQPPCTCQSVTCFTAVKADFATRASFFTEAVVGLDHPTVPPLFLTTVCLLQPTSTSTTVDSGGDERASSIDHEDDDDGRRGSGSGGGSAGPDSSPTCLDMVLAFFYF